MKKKGWLIVLGVTVAIVVLFVILSFTLFSLKHIEIDYRTSTQNIEMTDEEIIESGNFKKGGSVFFHGKKNYINNIEEANPYIKVINIETVFPSKFVVHIAERQEVYAVESSFGYYICDEEMKVLRIQEEADESLPILLQNKEVVAKEYEVGDKIEMAHKVNIYSAFYENNRPIGEQVALIEKIELFEEYDKVLKKDIRISKLTLQNGLVFKIVDDSYGLKYKVKMLIDVFSQYHNFVGKEITVRDEEGKETKVILTEENLKSATFVIASYYDKTSHSESECYFDIVLSVVA